MQRYKHHDLTNPNFTSMMLQNKDGKARFISPGRVGRPSLTILSGFGVGLIRSQSVPSLNLEIQLLPNQYRRVYYGISYTANFFFEQLAIDGRFQTFRNDFLNVGIAMYGYNKDSRTILLGREIASFYVGAPIYRRGTYFDSNTIRLGGTAYHKGLFKVRPERYMSGFFKKVYPGLQLVIGF